MPNKYYQGDTDPKGRRRVRINRGDSRGLVIFCPRRSLRVEAYTDRFDWGCLGLGSAQLALAILLEETSPDEAKRRYHGFKREIIGCLRKSWALNTVAVQRWLYKDRVLRPLKEEKPCSF